MRAKILAGTTSYSQPIYVTNSSAGGGLGSLVFNTSGLVGEYRRAGSSTWTAISLVTATLGTWTSGGWIADGSATGAYEVGIPNAAVAAGVPWVAIRFYGAANMTPVLLYVELDAVNYQSATAFLTAINAVAPPTNWNLMSIDASGRIDIGKILGTASAGTAGYMGLDWAHINGPTTTVVLSGTTVGTVTTYTGNTPQTGDSYPRLGAPSGASISADIAAIKSETDTILTDVNTGGGAIYARLGAPTGASVSADIASVKTSVGSVTNPVSLLLTQAIPTSNTAQSVGDALNAARAQGFGPWTITGTSWVVYAADGITPVRTFTLNSATTPTSRT